MSKLTRFAVAFDTHGDMIDPQAEAAFFDFVKHFKPTLRIHGGDFIDMRPLRRGASDEEKADSIAADIEMGVGFLRRFAPDVVTLGNHDDRLWENSNNSTNAVVRQMCTQLIDSILDKLSNTQFIPYDKRNFYQLGQYRVIHGFTSGLYAARVAAQSYGNVLMGHVHTPAVFSNPHIDGSEGISSGCLCRTDMSYNKKALGTLRQANGWLYGVCKGNLAQVWLAKKLGDSWVYPSEIKNG